MQKRYSFGLAAASVLLSGCIEFSFLTELKVETESFQLQSTEGALENISTSPTKVYATYDELKNKGYVQLDLQKKAFRFDFTLPSDGQQKFTSSLVQLLLKGEDTKQPYDFEFNYHRTATTEDMWREWRPCVYACDYRPERVCPGNQWVEVSRVSYQESGNGKFINPEDQTVPATFATERTEHTEITETIISSCR